MLLPFELEYYKFWVVFSMWVKGGLILRYATLQIDVATDAIQHDQIRSMYDVQLRGGEETAATASARSQLGPRHRNSYDSLNNGDEEETGSATAAAGHQVSRRL